MNSATTAAPAAPGTAELDLDVLVGELESAVPAERQGAVTSCERIYCIPNA